MTKRAISWVCLGLAVLGLGIVSCGGGDQPPADADGPRVLARVADDVITEEDLELAISSLPKHQQPQYESTLGRMRLLDELVKRKLIMRAAVAEDLHEDPVIKKRMQDFRERLLTHAYNNYLIEQLPKPSEEDLREYYDTHRSEFIIPARVNASYIKCATQADAEAARQRVVEGGEHFGTVAREVTVDDCSRRDGGLLGYFNPTGYVRCIGKRPEFSARAFELEADDVGPVFECDGGWCFIKVHEKNTERPEPFRKARERIAVRLRPQLTDSLIAEELERLRERFPVEKYMDLEQELAGKSADDLMRLATEVADESDKIEYFRALLERYPHYERAAEAQFMIGFVLSETLRDFDKAKVEYRKVIENYPDSEMKDSAYYMLQNMGKADLPPFGDETAAPRDAP